MDPRRRCPAQSHADETSRVGEGYKVIRKTGPFEVLTHVYHELGIQSNILVSAKYRHTGAGILTPAKLLSALHKVIREHPALSAIGVSQPSEKKEGNHRLWEAVLPAVYLENCVEFLDVDLDGDATLCQVFENAHSHWFDTQNKTKPWWKAIVVNGIQVVFVYHHSIGDGLSGYAFHRSLLTALNDDEVISHSTGAATKREPYVTADLNKMPPPYPFGIGEKLFWPYIIYVFLFWNVVRFFINQKYFLFSDAVYSKTYPTVAKPLPTQERTVTKIETLRIDRETMAKCLTACRDHQTSFTGLLHTLIQVTLASDIYPNAKIGFSRLAVNIRPKVHLRPDIFTNAVSTYSRAQLLGQYRFAGAIPRHQVEARNDFQGLHVNSRLVWKLAANYKNGVRDFVKSSRPLQDILTGKLLGEDVEEIDGTFHAMSLYMNNSFLVSNLSVFEPREAMSNGNWEVSDVAFSAGAIRASLGEDGIVFNVASAKNADCMICATYKEGVLKVEMVRTALDRVLGRLKLMVST